MNIEFNCPECGQLLAIDPKYAGTSVRCPKCKAEMQIPFGQKQSKRGKGKYKRKNLIIFVALFVAPLLIIGYLNFRSSPQKVLSKYLDASLHCRHKEVYQYVSTKDKAVKSLRQYVSEQSGLDSPFAQGFASKISHEIKNIEITGSTARGDVAISMPDFIGMFGDILGMGLATAFTGEEEETEKMIAEKYKEKNIPMATTIETFNLVREKGGWKVFLDWKTEKDEAEKNKKVEVLLSEAEQLKKKKNLYEALKTYDKVLELNSEMVEAKQSKNEIQKEIRAFEDKQSYTKYIELKEFRVGKGSRFSFGEPEPAIFGKVVNHGNRILTEVEVTVYFLGKDGKPIAEEDYHPVLVTNFSFGDDNKPLKPGYIKEFGYVVGNKVPSEWSGKARAKITNMEFQE